MERFDDEDVETATSADQLECEEEVGRFLLLAVGQLSEADREELVGAGFLAPPEGRTVRLVRERHVQYLRRGFQTLPGSFFSMDASRGWIVYWVAHGLDLLGYWEEGQAAGQADAVAGWDGDADGDGLEEAEARTDPEAEAEAAEKRAERDALRTRLVDTLKGFQTPTGGFGSGPMQVAHNAPTYAATLTLGVMGTPEAFDAIDRCGMYQYLLRIKSPCGGFCMQEDGEVDVRATYTALSVAALINILTPELVDGAAEYLLSCQTYEGGFGGEPFNEAHGGYTFCAFAALVILKQAHRANLPALERWLVQRQTRFAGGFQGRTNKLVDACYSFWQGGALALLEIVRRGYDDPHVLAAEGLGPPLLHPPAGDDDGGVGSPGTSTHTSTSTTKRPATSCENDNMAGSLVFNQRLLQRYLLKCGQCLEGGLRDKPGRPRDFYHTCYALSGLSIAQHYLGENGTVHYWGSIDSIVMPTSAIYNIRPERVRVMMKHFQNAPCDHASLTQPHQAQHEPDG